MNIRQYLRDLWHGSSPALPVLRREVPIRYDDGMPLLLLRCIALVVGFLLLLIFGCSSGSAQQDWEMATIIGGICVMFIIPVGMAGLFMVASDIRAERRSKRLQDNMAMHPLILFANPRMDVTRRVLYRLTDGSSRAVMFVPINIGEPQVRYEGSTYKGMASIEQLIVRLNAHQMEQQWVH